MADSDAEMHRFGSARKPLSACPERHLRPQVPAPLGSAQRRAAGSRALQTALPRHQDRRLRSRRTVRGDALRPSEPLKVARPRRAAAPLCSPVVGVQGDIAASGCRFCQEKGASKEICERDSSNERELKWLPLSHSEAQIRLEENSQFRGLNVWAGRLDLPLPEATADGHHCDVRDGRPRLALMGSGASSFMAAGSGKLFDLAWSASSDEQRGERSVRFVASVMR